MQGLERVAQVSLGGGRYPWHGLHEGHELVHHEGHQEKGRQHEEPYHE